MHNLIFCARFREKLCPLIPALVSEDFEDSDTLIDTEVALVHCICYVTAKFLPGGTVIQEALYPNIFRIAEGKFPNDGKQNGNLSNVMALVILYCYADLSSPSLQVSQYQSKKIFFWPLKSVVELYALQSSLHNSIQELRTEIVSKRSGPIFDSVPYRRYVLWLQIFLISH